jgi:hypothetical protein
MIQKRRVVTTGETRQINKIFMAKDMLDDPGIDGTTVWKLILNK